MNHIKRALFEG